MHFDPENEVVSLCAQGMEMEGKKNLKDASRLYSLAWELATTDTEKFVAAHYMARIQETVADKLGWDQTALAFALKIKEVGIESVLPSLYLNIAKCFEDLGDTDIAIKNYQLAISYTGSLPDNSYGQLIKDGIEAGLQRMNR
jgi:rifampin ADP-ribosylating transferase